MGQSRASFDEWPSSSMTAADMKGGVTSMDRVSTSPNRLRTSPRSSSLSARATSTPSAHAMVERDGFGFVPYDSVMQGQQEGSWEWTQNMKLIERRFVYVTQLLREAFPDLEEHKIKVRHDFPQLPLRCIHLQIWRYAAQMV